MSKRDQQLVKHLAAEYSFHVLADPDGGYVILYPDLPGCMTQIEGLDEVPEMADEIRQLWIETEYERGEDIPPPSSVDGPYPSWLNQPGPDPSVRTRS